MTTPALVHDAATDNTGQPNPHPAPRADTPKDGIRTTIVGRLTEDPTVGYTGTGNLWVRLNVASHERVRGADGAWTDSEPTYTQAVVFGQRAETAGELSKGDRIEVVGRPEVETFTRRDGSFAAAMKVIATSVTPAPLPQRAEPTETAAPGLGAGHVTIHHNDDHTIAVGVQKGDVAIRETLKESGFQWSAPRKAWYLPASMPAAERGQRAGEVNEHLIERYGVATATTEQPAPGTPAADVAAAGMTGAAPGPPTAIDSARITPDLA